MLIDSFFDIYIGKMVLLDKLLPKLKERDSRVLIFSQVCFPIPCRFECIIYLASVC
jgi:hypothetical protein